MTPTGEPIYWILFLAFIGFLLFLDLFVFHRKAHVVHIREAAIFSAFWVGLGVSFGIFVVFWLGPTKGIEYFTGYLIEKSLSVDNVFVFALIFGAFAVPAQYQHRVLFWGVVGALAMRFVMIVVGSALIETYQWILYLFGAFLILTGIRLYQVGLPGKSGIGGGIVTVSPGKGGLGTFSPPLDEAGNSVRGQLVAAYLSRRLGLDIFASAVQTVAPGSRSLG